MEAIRVAAAMVSALKQTTQQPQDPMVRARQARLSTISRRVVSPKEVIRVVSATVQESEEPRHTQQPETSMLTRTPSKDAIPRPLASPRSRIALYRVKKGEAKKSKAETETNVDAVISNPLFRSSQQRKSRGGDENGVEMGPSRNKSSSTISSIMQFKFAGESRKPGGEDEDDSDDDVLPRSTRGRSNTFSAKEASPLHHRKESRRLGARISVGVSGATDANTEWSRSKIGSRGSKRTNTDRIARTHQKNYVEGVYENTPKGVAKPRKLSASTSNTRTAVMLTTLDSRGRQQGGGDDDESDDDEYESEQDEYEYGGEDYGRESVGVTHDPGPNNAMNDGMNGDLASPKGTLSRLQSVRARSNTRDHSASRSGSARHKKGMSHKGSVSTKRRRRGCCSRLARRFCHPAFRIFRTVAAFPFAIVLCSLQLRLHPRYGRKLLYILNGMVFGVPFIIVDQLSKLVQGQLQRLQKQREDGTTDSAGGAPLRFDFSRETTFAVVAFVSFVLLPVMFKISRQVHEAFSFDRVGLGSFCFRPSYGFRWNRANILTIGGILFEWFQHSLYCLPVDFVPRLAKRFFNFGTSSNGGDVTTASGGGGGGGADAHTSMNAATYEDLVGIPFAYIFWLVFAFVSFNFVMVVLRLTLVGRKQYQFGDCWQLWLLVYYINGPLFVSIVTVLSQGLVCSYERDAPPVLVFSPSTQCWQGGHRFVAVSAMGALALYLPHATLLPSGTYKETMRNPDLVSEKRICCVKDILCKG
jgi:hypothetical protein